MKCALRLGKMIPKQNITKPLTTAFIYFNIFHYNFLLMAVTTLSFVWIINELLSQQDVQNSNFIISKISEPIMYNMIYKTITIKKQSH